MFVTNIQGIEYWDNWTHTNSGLNPEFFLRIQNIRYFNPVKTITLQLVLIFILFIQSAKYDIFDRKIQLFIFKFIFIFIFWLYNSLKQNIKYILNSKLMNYASEIGYFTEFNSELDLKNKIEIISDSISGIKVHLTSVFFCLICVFCFIKFIKSFIS